VTARSDCHADLAVTIADTIMEEGSHPISCSKCATAVCCHGLARLLPPAAERKVEEGRGVGYKKISRLVSGSRSTHFFARLEKKWSCVRVSYIFFEGKQWERITL
jgi:hypothetical protein